MKRLLIPGLIGVITAAAPAAAQDVIVMRRSINPAQIQEAPSHQAIDWAPGTWSDWTTSCGANARRTRTVSCLRADGTPQPDSACTSARPETEQVEDRYVSCSYAWATGEFSAYSSTCSDKATRSRTVSCQAGDPSTPQTVFTVEDSRCPAPVPARTESTEVLSGCSYDWQVTSTGGWSSSCSATNTRPVTAVCRRSDGATVADSLCSAKGPKPTVETAASCDIKNGSAENGTADWGMSNGGFTSSTDYARSGTRSFRMGRNGGMYQTVQWPASNGGFRISFWMYIPSSNPPLPAYCNDGDEIRANAIAGIAYASIPRDTWVQRTTGGSYMNPRSAGSMSLEILSTVSCYNTSTEYPVYIDDVTLEIFP